MNRFYEMAQHQGSYAGHLSDLLAQDNTRDPISGKYMLQSYGQYNVGVLLVRFIQLYSLSIKEPAKYEFKIEGSTTTNWRASKSSIYVKLILLTSKRYRVSFEDLPQEVNIHIDAGQDSDDIVLKWPHETRADKLYKLSLNEDTGVISAHFRGNGKDVIKSSDGRTEYVVEDVTDIGYEDVFIKHREQGEGPAVITADGDREYWENGGHIRTESRGQYIKG